MKQTNLFNCGLCVNRWVKPLGLAGLCMAFVFILGAQTGTAQTMTELGEQQSAHTLALIKGEMQFLELEQKNPAGSVKTDKNDQIIAYYNDVINSFKQGGDIKEAFMYVESTYGSHEGSVQFATHPTNSVMDPTSSDIKDLQLLVNQLNLSDANDSDLEAIFNYWRTLKNQ